MAYFGNFVAAALLATFAAPVAAQSSGIPAEFPPSTFSGNQYVDSDGCAFIRAGISGITNWVPRVDRTRTQLCNFQPTFATAVEEQATAVVAPEPEIAMAAPAPQVPAVDSVSAATDTVASLVLAPNVAPLVRAPQPVPTPARVAPSPQAAPAPQSSPAPMSMAQACEGRYGIQSGFISRSTGQPIDCGPAPQVAEVVESQPRRMTLAQACAEMANAGTVLIDASTSRPVACPTSTIVATATAPSIALPAGPAAPAQVGAPTAPTTAQVSQACGGSVAQMRTVDGYAVRCGPQNQLPYTIANTAAASVTSRAKTGSFASLFRAPDVPVSNPTTALHEAIQRPAGYENVWSDGRLNPHRGLPKPQATATRAQTARALKPGHNFIQVGTFGDHNNASRLGQRLVGLGLPVGLVNRGAMKMVVSGPYNDPSALRQALNTVRSMGFTDAYTRN